jgi:signal peptidase I
VSAWFWRAIVALEVLAVIVALLLRTPAALLTLAALAIGIVRVVRRADIRGILLLISTLVVPVAVLLLLSATVVGAYRVPSGSMLPTLHVGDRILVNRLAGPSLGDVVVFHPPLGAEGTGDACGNPSPPAGAACDRPTAGPASVSFIKRVVALPGDRISIRDGHVIRNGRREPDTYVTPCAGGSACNLPTEIKIPPGHYFMLGDNVGESDDSRFWGPVPKAWIVGKVIWRNGPLSRIGSL